MAGNSRLTKDWRKEDRKGALNFHRKRDATAPAAPPRTTRIGKADILWRDTAGNLALWLMNGLTIIGTSNLGNVTTAWTIAGVGDFNGDSKSDILWRHTSGDLAMWRMNGGTIVNTFGLGVIPTSWTTQ
jgi:hypothetical protein